MQITRETDYAIRCVLHLAHAPERVVMVEEIAAARYVPVSFLAKILQKLKRAKIVRSFRGVKGGFQLARAPEDVTLLDVIEAIQGKVAMNACAVDPKICELSPFCVVHPIWKDVRADVEQMLRKHDFRSLAEKDKARNP